ncbi:MAG: flagellar biosynthetic protein FliO [Pseudomonadota bacterium]
MTDIGQVGQLILALGLVIGMVLLLGFVARRIQGMPAQAKGELALLDSLHLGPKEKVVLVRAGQTRIAFALHGQCIEKLAEWPETVAEAQTQTHTQEQAAPSQSKFDQLLSRSNQHLAQEGAQ